MTKVQQSIPQKASLVILVKICPRMDNWSTFPCTVVFLDTELKLRLATFLQRCIHIVVLATAIVKLLSMNLCSKFSQHYTFKCHCVRSHRRSLPNILSKKDIKKAYFFAYRFISLSALHKIPLFMKLQQRFLSCWMSLISLFNL